LPLVLHSLSLYFHPPICLHCIILQARYRNGEWESNYLVRSYTSSAWNDPGPSPQNVLLMVINIHVHIRPSFIQLATLWANLSIFLKKAFYFIYMKRMVQLQARPYEFSVVCIKINRAIPYQNISILIKIEKNSYCCQYQILVSVALFIKYIFIYKIYRDVVFLCSLHF
jgi:hypothetical protein